MPIRENLRTHQWSFCKTGTVGTLVTPAKIGACVQTLCIFAGVGRLGYHTQKNLEIVIAKSCNLVRFGILKHFNSGNAVSMCYGCFSAMGTAFPRVPPRSDPRCTGWCIMSWNMYCCSTTTMLLKVIKVGTALWKKRNLCFL